MVAEDGDAQTDGQLYDLLHRLFGLGVWHEDLSDVEWWKARQHEVTKIKRSRTARRVEIKHLALAARYAKAHGEDIRAVTWLYKLIPDAVRWDNARRRAAGVAELDELITAAMQVADPSWQSRLARARGDYRKELYDEWKAQQPSPL